MRAEAMRATLGIVAIAAVAGLGLAAISVWHQLHQPMIVTVDIVALAGEAAPGHRDQAAMAMYARDIERELSTMAREEHLVILPRQAVAAGTQDITDRVRKRLRR